MRSQVPKLPQELTSEVNSMAGVTENEQTMASNENQKDRFNRRREAQELKPQSERSGSTRNR